MKTNIILSTIKSVLAFLLVVGLSIFFWRALQFNSTILLLSDADLQQEARVLISMALYNLILAGLNYIAFTIGYYKGE